MIRISKENYKKYGECVSFEANDIKLLVTIELGPRIIFYGKDNQNILFADLKDTTNNVLVFKSIVPSDWKGLIESNWNIVSSSTPGKETIYLSNLDGTAKITFVSQQTFVENNKYAEGENREYYTTYLHYMNALLYQL